MEEIREESANTAIPTPAEVAKPKKKKVAQPPTRLPEDLADVTPKKMTDKEKDTYIEFLRQELDYAMKANVLFRENASSAYEKASEADARAKRVAEQANLKLNLVKDNVRIMANNVMTILEK